jgi:Bacteriophage tail tube protein
MSGNLPAYILKSCTLFVDKETKVGQTEQITLPTLEIKTEEMRNGGMIKPREVPMGYNVTTASFTVVGVDPALYKLLGFAPGANVPIIAYGYVQDEDGAEHSARAEMTCLVKKLDGGDWKEAEVAPTQIEMAVHAYRFFMDDEEVARLDDFNAVFGGVSVMPGRADALRLA